MFTYVVKRVLLMIPTLFGISLVIWLVMTAAPGRPGRDSKGMGDDVKAEQDPAKRKEQNESQRLFRRQYGLDRPLLFNTWPWLSKDDLRPMVRTAQAPIEEVGIEAKRTAMEQLEDYGHYAVPPLVELLGATEGAEQDAILAWLRFSATQNTTLGDDAATTAANQRIIRENEEVKALVWPEGAPASARAPIVAGWQAWFRERAERWNWSFVEKVRLLLTDTQFGTYWARLLRLDLGKSHRYKRPVLDLVLERLPLTASLAFVSILLVYLLAIPLGIWSAVKPYTFADRTISISLFLLYSLPSFFIGTVLLRAFTIGDPMRWFPTGDIASTQAPQWNSWERLKDVLWHVTLPLVTMTYAGLAGLSRFARTGMLDVIRSDFVRTARAKGLGETEVILRHAARNGMMPMVTLLAGLLPSLVGGSVVVEFMFNLNGMGLLTLEAINNRDYNIVVGESLIVAVLTQVGILASDILYAVMDPRVSYK